MSKKLIGTIEGEGIIDFFHKLIYGRKELSPSVKKFLVKHGNEEIASIEINRKPIRTILIEVLNFISNNKFKENMKNLNYDKVFHLKMNIRTKKGTYFSIEKNEVVKIQSNPKNDPSSESLNVPNIPAHLTTSKMIENAQQKVGADNLFIYSAQHRNCQHFITDLLKGSGINNRSIIDFVKQDIQGLFENTGWLRKIANITTDLAGRFNVIQEGEGFSDMMKKYSEDDYKKYRDEHPVYALSQKVTGSGGVFSDMVKKYSEDDYKKYRDEHPVYALSQKVEGSGVKKSNKWIEHIRNYAKTHNLSYACALSNPDCKNSYRTPSEPIMKIIRVKKNNKKSEITPPEPIMKIIRVKKNNKKSEITPPEPIMKKIRVKKNNVKSVLTPFLE